MRRPRHRLEPPACLPTFWTRAWLGVKDQSVPPEGPKRLDPPEMVSVEGACRSRAWRTRPDLGASDGLGLCIETR
jgi:hypothetical protein